MKQNHPARGLATLCLDYSAHTLFRLEENQGLRILQRQSLVEKKGSQRKTVLEGKKSRKDVVKILEIGKDPKNWTATWRQMLGDTQEPWPIIPGRGKCEQQHGGNWLGFLPDTQGPAAIFLLGKEVNT